jgi:spore coat protein U-like protein
MLLLAILMFALLTLAVLLRVRVFVAFRAHPRSCCATLALAVLAAPVQAQVVCAASASSVDFGIYDVLANNATLSNGSVQVRCVNSSNNQRAVPFTVQLSAGNVRSYGGQREARNGGDSLRYQLFDSAARRDVVGDGTAGTVALAGSVLLPPQLGERTATLTVFGAMPARQDVPPGVYTDSLVVTVLW